MSLPHLRYAAGALYPATTEKNKPLEILGLRTTIYKVADLEKAKAWYAEAFGAAPASMSRSMRASISPAMSWA